MDYLKRYLDLNTSHLSPDIMGALTEMVTDPPFGWVMTGYGYWLTVPEAEHEAERLESYDELTDAAAVLAPIFALARQLDADRILFDSDAPVCPRLASWDDDGELTEPEPDPNSPHWLWTALVDRAYGGPEEGGWYYGCGQPVGDPECERLGLPRARQYPTEADALAAGVAAQAAFDAANADRPSIDSVLSQGRYEALVTAEPPAPFPKVKPHYE